MLDLRGTFLLPELREQGLLHRFGSGLIAHAVPIDAEYMIIHTDTSVFLHSQHSPAPLWEIDCPSFHFAIDVPHNLLALVPEERIITLWDMSTGQLLHQLQYQTKRALYQVNPNGLEFNHDGSIVAAGMEGEGESVITLWDTESGQLLRVLTMENAFDDITTLAFHPTRHMLAAGSFNDHKVWFWNLDDGSLLSVWDLSEHGRHDRPYDLAFRPDGSQLFVGGGTSGLRIWNVEQSQEVPCSLSAHHLQPNWLAVDPLGRFLAVMHFGSSQDQALRILEIGSWQTVYAYAGELARPMFSLDGRYLAVSPSRSGPARLFEVATGKEVALNTFPYFFAASLALQPTEHMIAGGGSGHIRLWSLKESSLLHELSLPARWSCGEMAFAPEGSVLAVSRRFGFQQFALDLWESVHGTLLFTLTGHAASVLALAFHPDGRLLASGSADKTLRIWDLESAQEVHCFHGHLLGITSLAFSPDGAIVASGSLDKTVRLWNIKDGTSLCELAGHTSTIRSIAFSPDGQTLASADEKGEICVWDRADQKQIGHLRAHTAAVNSLAFRPDGRFLASGSDDQTVRIWDYPDKQERSCLKPYQGKIQRVAFSADGHRLMTGAVDCVRFWKIETLIKEII